MSRQARYLYEFGPFRLEETERLLLREGRPVPLPPKVFETLLLLVQRSGHVVEKDEIMKVIWHDSFVEEANLTQNVFTLRKALGEDKNGNVYIETVPKRGYRFVANVREVGGEDADPEIERPTATQIITEEDEEPSRQDQASQKTLAGVTSRHTRKAASWIRRPISLVLSALLLGLVLASFYLWDPGKKTETAAGVKSIAVLPFKSIDGEGDNEHLGLGMTDAFINRLSNIRQIDVRPTRAILKYSGDGHDLLAAGRALGVDAVLDGSVWRAGDRVRVIVQLVRVRDGMPLWADKFDAKFTDIFSVQDSVSEQVAQALTLTLNVGERKQLAKRPTNNAEAYQAYLKGRYFWNKRSVENYQKAMEYFEQAIELDPQYAQAYAGLADAYALLGSMGNAFLPRREAMHRARAAAMKALEIDDTLAEAHTSLAFVKMQHDWDWPGAEREFKRAIELNPSYATAHHWYAYYLAAMGRHAEAIREIRRAQEIDPLSLIINTDVGEIFYYASRYDEAIEQCRKTIEMDTNFTLAHRVLAWAYEEKGMHAEAITELQKAVSISEDETNILASLGHVYAMSEKRDEARRVLNHLKKLSIQSYVPSSDIAIVYASLGEKDQAFAWLEKAYEDRSGSLILLKVWPLMDPLRSDPRFADLVRRVGLAP
jgi:DNA-binding winged helix-turn-helix (wHTH) protein/TolB-like protein/Flp pilus assembly protein TadD